MMFVKTERTAYVAGLIVVILLLSTLFSGCGNTATKQEVEKTITEKVLRENISHLPNLYREGENKVCKTGACDIITRKTAEKYADCLPETYETYWPSVSEDFEYREQGEVFSKEILADILLSRGGRTEIVAHPTKVVKNVQYPAMNIGAGDWLEDLMFIVYLLFLLLAIVVLIALILWALDFLRRRVLDLLRNPSHDNPVHQAGAGGEGGDEGQQAHAGAAAANPNQQGNGGNGAGGGTNHNYTGAGTVVNHYNIAGNMTVNNYGRNPDQQNNAEEDQPPATTE